MSLRTLVDSGGIAEIERPEVPEAETRIRGGSLWNAFRDRHTRSRAQRELQWLSDHLLDDLGLQRELLEGFSDSCWDRP